MPNVDDALGDKGLVRFAGKHRQSGFTSVENSLLLDSSLSVAARMTYVLLSSYAWQKDECWPGQAGLAKILGVTEKTLRSYLTELFTAGLLEAHRRGMGKTNLYILHAPDARTVISTDQDRDPTTVLDRDPTTDKEDEGEEDEEDGSPNRPVTTGLPVLPGEPEVPTRARAKPETLGSLNANALCHSLADQIEANGCRRPTITKAWLDEARLLVDRDGVSVEEVDLAIRWATSHHFWKANILSMPTLRRQFDRLRMQAKAERVAGPRQREKDAAQSSIQRLVESERARELTA